MEMNKLTAKDLMVGYKFIPQYENRYSIDENGNVFSHVSGRILKPQKNHRGYLMVDLYKNGKAKKGIIHRLVAITYIPNPQNLPEIDHIDTNRQNNNVNNLKWCTRKENCNNPLTLKHGGDSRRGERHHLFGKNLSDETKKRMSESRKGHIISEETKKKISIAKKGKKMSDEQKKMLHDFWIGKRISINNPMAKNVKQFDMDGKLIKIWGCASDAAKELKISRSAIYQCVKGTIKTAGGFIWKR
jgi:hypothetical protein